MVRAVSKCLYCKCVCVCVCMCVCVEGFRSVRIKKRFTAGPAVGRPASPARVLRAVRHLSAGHDLFSRCAQLQSQPGHARGWGDLYTQRSRHGRIYTVDEDTKLKKWGKCIFLGAKIHVEHTFAVSFYLDKPYSAGLHFFLSVFYFFYFDFQNTQTWRNPKIQKQWQV